MHFKLFLISRSMYDIVVKLLTMLIVMRVVSELFPTGRTFIGFFPSMDPQMHRQTTALTEKLATVTAWVRALSCVGALVPNKVVLLLECLVTLHATVRSRLIVGQHIRGGAISAAPGRGLVLGYAVELIAETLVF